MEELFIYRIWQTVNNNYDTYDSAVVCAATEEEARRSDVGELRSWCKLEDVQVELIGVAKPDLYRGVILCSYNAG